MRSIPHLLLAFAVLLAACTNEPPLVQQHDPICGNRVLEHGENCDGGSLGGATCQALGYEGGSLGCTARCTFDTGACTVREVCGNGADDDRDGYIDCADEDCFESCPHCGDGVRDLDEACDGADFGSDTCETRGFATGRLACTASCRLDTSDCRRAERCDNGRDDDEDSLVDCDDPDCREKEPCPRCGDGTVNVDGEQCDGSTGGKSCADFGFEVGTLACSHCRYDFAGCGLGEDCEAPGDEDDDGLADCDDPQCSTAFGCPRCGNGVLQQGEACDGSTRPACTDLGFDGGVTRCEASCQVNTSGCRYFVCGDGIRDADERCDDGNQTPGDGCEPGCMLLGDVCEVPVALAWGAEEAAWIWDGDLGRFQADHAASCGGSNLRDAVASFTAPAAGRYYATVYAAFDSVLSARRGPCGANSSEFACSAARWEGGTETIEFDAEAGEIVFLLVSRTSAGIASDAFHLSAGPVVCGDGRIDGLEQCEDGNFVNGDGCDDTCRWEGDSCADAYDLNAPSEFGFHPLDGPTPPDAHRWVWAANAALFDDDFASPDPLCGGAAQRDGVARFVVPRAGTWSFEVLATFRAGLRVWEDACGEGSSELWCNAPGGGPNPIPPGEVRREATWTADLAAGQVLYLVIDGFVPGADAGDFWLIASEHGPCGDGAVQFAEWCDDGNLVSGDGCSATCWPDFFELGPNDVITQAMTYAFGKVAFGDLNLAALRPGIDDPIDYWSFLASAGTTYEIRTSSSRTFDGSCPRANPDTYLRLMRNANEQLATNDDIDPDTRCSRIVWTATANEWLFVEVGLSAYTPVRLGSSVYYEPHAPAYFLTIEPLP